MMRVSASAATSYNDGMVCPNVVLPFATCGDKNGPNQAPSPTNAITDGDCGAGYTSNTAAQHTVCQAIPCVVGSAAAADQAVCCLPQGHRMACLCSTWHATLAWTLVLSLQDVVNLLLTRCVISAGCSQPAAHPLCCLCRMQSACDSSEWCCWHVHRSAGA